MSTAPSDAPFAEIADAIPHVVWTHDETGKPTYVNRQWTEYTGAPLDETLAAGPMSFVHASDRARVTEEHARARASGGPFTTKYRLRDASGGYRMHEARVVPVRGAGAGVVLWVSVAMDVDGRERHDEEQRYLAQASAVLGTSLEVEKTLSDVARMLVPKLADWCAIDLLGANDTLVRAAVQHIDPSKVELARRLHELQPPQREAPHGAYQVMRTRVPEIVHVTDDMLVAAIQDPEILAVARGLGLVSAITVPLLARDRVLGALALVSAESGRRYELADVAFAEEVARRISIAIDNARLFEEATRSRAAAEALATEVLEQSKAVEAQLLRMREERDAARAELEKLRGATA